MSEGHDRMNGGDKNARVCEREGGASECGVLYVRDLTVGGGGERDSE